MYRGRSFEVHRRALAAVEKLKGRSIYGRRSVALADLVDAGLTAELDELERTENGGNPFVDRRRGARRQTT